jgi:hypothetical protein
MAMQDQRGDDPGGAEIENVSLPAVTLTVGSPNRCPSAGDRMKGPFRPVCTSVKEPSGWPKNFPWPVLGHGNGLPRLHVHVRDRDGAG